MRRSALTQCGDTVLGRQHGHSIKQPLSSALTPPPFCAALLCPPRGTARDTRRHLVRRYRGNGLPEGGAGHVPRGPHEAERSGLRLPTHLALGRRYAAAPGFGLPHGGSCSLAGPAPTPPIGGRE